MSRVDTAGAPGFFDFNQCGDRPDTYLEPGFFEVIPSHPNSKDHLAVIELQMFNEMNAGVLSSYQARKPSQLLVEYRSGIWRKKAVHHPEIQEQELLSVMYMA